MIAGQPHTPPNLRELRSFPFGKIFAGSLKMGIMTDFYKAELL